MPDGSPVLAGAAGWESSGFWEAALVPSRAPTSAAAISSIRTIDPPRLGDSKERAAAWGRAAFPIPSPSVERGDTTSKGFHVFPDLFLLLARLFVQLAEA